MSDKLQEFADACERWRDWLGLTDWSVDVRSAPPGADTEATVDADVDSRQASVTFQESDRPVRTALHEMLHILLADVLAETARTGSDTHPAVQREEHRVIERLLNAIGENA